MPSCSRASFQTLASTSSRGTAIFTRRSDLLATMAGAGSEDSLAQPWGRLAAAGDDFDRGCCLAVREQGGDGAAVEVQRHVEHSRLHGRRDAGPQGKLAPIRLQRHLAAVADAELLRVRRVYLDELLSRE